MTPPEACHPLTDIDLNLAVGHCRRMSCSRHLHKDLSRTSHVTWSDLHMVEDRPVPNTLDGDTAVCSKTLEPVSQK